jgi:hypothetical protein
MDDERDKFFRDEKDGEFAWLFQYKMDISSRFTFGFCHSTDETVPANLI